MDISFHLLYDCSKYMKITKEQILKMAKKISRETNIMPKPIIYLDKKKDSNKKKCRKKNIDESD